MTDLEKKLAEEHKRVVEEVGQNPLIHISFSDGEPPRKYEVEYTIKGGVRQGDGSIKAQETHRVAILLPFGYPNFPPNCKPLTPLFHPDFDPAAICINDYWSESQSLPGLIVYIGKMIAGQIFGYDNAFNPEAAQWYKENSDRLPFDAVNLDGVASPPKAEQGVVSLPSQGDDTVLELSLDENELPPVEEIDAALGEAPQLHETEFQQTTGLEEGNDVTSQEPSVSSPPESVVPEAQPLPAQAAEGEGEEDADDATAGAYAKEEKRLRNKKLGLAIGVVLFLLMAGGGFLLIHDIMQFHAAEDIWHESEPLLVQRQYIAVQKNAQKALERLNSLKILKKNEAVHLQQTINTILQSAEFQGGLAGKVLYNGQYVTESTIPIRESIRVAMEKGDAALLVERGEAALLFFREAQKLAESIKLNDEELGTKIEDSIAQSRLQLLVDKGTKALNSGQLSDAVTSFQKAAELVNVGVEIDPDKRVYIHQSLDRALLQKFMKEGEGAFTAIQLDKALQSFNQALLLAEKETSAAPEYAEKIRQAIQQIHLYQLLERGKADFESLQWEDALGRFREALKLIEGDSFGSYDMSSNERSIRKKITQISVRISEEKIVASKEQGKLKEALAEVERLLGVIRKSRFKDDNDMRQKVQELRQQQSALKEEIDRREKIVYLTNNFETIFKENHSLARSASLRAPYVRFVKREGQKQVYNLKCTGYTTTGKITLELSYQYDEAAKRWSLYNGS